MSLWKQLIPYIIGIIYMKAVVLLPMLLPVSTILLRFAHGFLTYDNLSARYVFIMAFPLSGTFPDSAVHQGK